MSSPTSTPRDARPKTPPSTQNGASQASKPAPKPFPSVTGGCTCNAIRYRLSKPPLFVYACHCPDCQKNTGSAFALFLNIETHCIEIQTPTTPVLVTQPKRPGLVYACYACPECKTELWSANTPLGQVIADVRVGTLDFPGLMEPDVHSFVESKMGWLVLPQGARTVTRDFRFREVWPKSSLRRLDVCLKRAAEAAERTPTAGEFGGEEGEDDEAFERRRIWRN
ncbi:hypothetical protein CC86DRAFT_154523 [Ophiobolus disseminans]|uniref:CENP-V/GFA domain-containing protein n=1 Tax=Ophiobolus disseminans TaxID=1469910 RepID=A0A6A6ZD52_9PLEO|nr:hypothetical protein CC86DRAFT_154523 [Ophiobolus disseminans]